MVVRHVPLVIYSHVCVPRFEPLLSSSLLNYSQFRLMLFSDGILEVLEDASLSDKEKYLLSHAPSSRADPESVLKNYAVDSTQKYPDDIAVLLVDKH